MFTTEQIATAHSKVKSGADFPAYIREIKNLGVEGYETFVADGHTQYFGEDSYSVATDAKYDPVPVADTCDAERFEIILKEHQRGRSDYITFISQCAECGIEKWTVSMEKMTCTYFDKAGNEVLEEAIPG